MTMKPVASLTDEELMAAHQAAAREAARKRAEIAAHNQRMDMINYVKKVFGNEIDTDLLQVAQANVEDAKP